MKRIVALFSFCIAFSQFSFGDSIELKAATLPTDIDAYTKTKGPVCTLEDGVRLQDISYVSRGLKNSDPMYLIVITEKNGSKISQFEGKVLDSFGPIVVISGNIFLKNKNDDMWRFYDLSDAEEKRASQAHLFTLTGVDENEYHKRCRNEE